MRPLLTLLVPIVILGGLSLYMEFRPRAAPPTDVLQAAASAGDFTVEVTLTFEAGQDEFALDAATAPSLVVQHNGRDLMRYTERLPAGRLLSVEHVANLSVGRNEFFVEATPAEVNVEAARAVRVRVLMNGEAIANQTLWSEPGEAVRGRIVFDIPAWTKPSN